MYQTHDSDPETPVQPYKKKYFHPLPSFLPYFENDGFNQMNIHHLLKPYSPAPILYRDCDILGLIPIEADNYCQTFILYQNNFAYVDRPPYYIISQLLKEESEMDFETYRKAFQHQSKSKTTVIPFATGRYSLIPLGPVRSKMTIWINPGQLVRMEPHKMNTLLYMTNHFTIKSDRLTRSLATRLSRGVFFQAVFKREFDAYSCSSYTHLLDYLDLPSTTVTREIIGDNRFKDIPFNKGDFHKSYEKLSIKKDD